MLIFTHFEWKSWPYLAVLAALSTFLLSILKRPRPTKSLCLKCLAMKQTCQFLKWKSWPRLVVFSCTFWLNSDEKVGRILLFWTSRAHFEFFRMKKLAVSCCCCFGRLVHILNRFDRQIKRHNAVHSSLQHCQSKLARSARSIGVSLSKKAGWKTPPLCSSNNRSSTLLT